MGYRVIPAALLALVTGTALGAQQPAPDMPASRHQSQALEQIEARFDALDANGDGYLVADEAKASSSPSGCWDEMGPGARLSRAEFVQPEARHERGVDHYQADDPTSWVPATRLQRWVTREIG
ncbi:MAG: hypothetical protein GWO02_03960 [Gammaproteobacteria bacterium]|nr:hypothetical protein [Gammaproteobacteria bacterium]